MLKSVSTDIEIFHELIESNSHYVDKTPFIKTIFQDHTVSVMALMRPGNFGKTLTLSTFHDFLTLNPENPGDTSRQEKWFKDTEILKNAEYKDFCCQYMGKFPVVFISLKQVDGSEFERAYYQFGCIVFDMYNSFSYLAESPKLNNAEKRIFNEIASDKNFICNIANKDRITDSLSKLLMFLHKHHGIKPILLIDEYEVPIAKAARNNYYKEMINIISPFLGNALKTNFDLDRAVLTGSIRATSESIFGGLNHFYYCTVIDDCHDDISGGLGFTEEETQKVLSYYELSDCYEEVRKNYGGYYFGDVQMLCPRDVMSFCKENYKKAGYNKAERENREITAGNYRINTGSSDVIEEFMRLAEHRDIDMMQSLMDGESIIVEVKEALCHVDLKRQIIDDFWTLLLFTGFLTFDPQYISEEEDVCSVHIPNEEIRKCFKSKILNFYKKNTVIKNRTDDLIKGLFTGDAELVENSLSGLLAKYVSIRDFSTRAPKENYYQGFMNGLLINGTSYIEEHKSNVESGDGYVDIIAASVNSDTVAVLELKQTDRPFGARLIAAQKAVEQIIEKDYASVYISDPLVRNVYAYGICFHNKSCSVVVKKLK